MQIVSPDQVGVSSQQLARVDAAMQSRIDQGVLGGIQILLARRDEVCHFASFGWMDRDSQTAMRDDAIFRIYSMTKPIVSAAILILYEEGRLQLTDPVSEYLPGFGDVQVYQDANTLAPLDRPIVIHDLLTHTAGFTYGFFGDHPVDAMYQEVEMVSRDQTNEEFIAKLTGVPLITQPGTEWRYSVATDVLGVLVAELMGQTLQEALTQLVFEPLNMPDTAFQVPTASLDRLSACYTTTEEGKLKRVMQDDDPVVLPVGFQSGGGGLASTAADYLRFCRMLLHRGTLDGVRLLGSRTVDWMASNHLTASQLAVSGPDDWADYGFGLGFRVLMDRHASRRLSGVGEYGWAGAADTYFWIDPREELIGLFMAQLIPSNGHPTARLFQSQAYAALQD